MTISCVTGETGGSCKSGQSSSSARETMGRRIYIHQDALTYLASQGAEQALLVYRMAARTVALKAVHHVHQDAAIFGLATSSGAGLLQETINLAWSDNTTQTLRRIGQRPLDPRGRKHLFPVLNDDEEIVASCYFSNYYTYATGEKTADLMFDDTNDIATLRRLKEETGQYADLSLISANCLVLVDPNIGFGENKADDYFKPLRSQSLLTKDQLCEIRMNVYFETQTDMGRMIDCSLDLEKSEDQKIKDDVLKALDYAFSKGILKGTQIPEREAQTAGV